MLAVRYASRLQAKPTIRRLSRFETTLFSSNFLFLEGNRPDENASSIFETIAFEAKDCKNYP